MACGQCALARVSYLESTRAKAPHNSHKVVPFYSGAWTNFVPGLTFLANSTPIVVTCVGRILS